jgi:hypothetical protein
VFKGLGERLAPMHTPIADFFIKQANRKKDSTFPKFFGDRINFYIKRHKIQNRKLKFKFLNHIAVNDLT